MKIILLFAIVLVLVQNVFGGFDMPLQCPDREEYTRCLPCPTTCKNMNSKNNECVNFCATGCDCVSGYVRDENNRCILPSLCGLKVKEPQDSVNGKCKGRNEIFKNCGSFCPRTCANRGNPDIVCKKGCQKGCYCTLGFFRNIRNKCVPASVCNEHDA